MTSVRWIERFEVDILHPDGRDVHSDREQLPGYPFERAMPDGRTVQDWKRQRFYATYPGFDVEVKPPVAMTLMAGRCYRRFASRTSKSRFHVVAIV
jgi:hypothetical protein